MPPHQIDTKCTVNTALASRTPASCRALAAATEGVTFVDCASPLLLRPDGSIDPARMPDALHPNELGYEAIFSECWDGAIADLLGRGGEGGMPGL